MQFGIHLPQIGEHVTAAMVGQAARDAEDRGFHSIWINDHLAIPAGAPYPPPCMFEPMIALTWAAAQTSRILLGTSVLVLPMRHPVHLAKEIASLDILSGGRMIAGVGVGWLEGEFDALGVPFAERGARTDDSIRLMRACWSEDPVEQDPVATPGRTRGMRTLPQPGRAIPIWVGGNSAPALRRAERLGDGWHGLGSRLTPEELRPIVERLRAARGADYPITLRTFWDALKDDTDELRRSLDAYAELGVACLVSEPRQRDFEQRRRAVEAMWRLAEPYRAAA